MAAARDSGGRPLSGPAAVVWSAAQEAYTDALSAASPALPAPLAARLGGDAAVTLLGAATQHEYSDFPSLALHVRFAAGGAGAELRFDYLSACVGWSGRAFRFSACWRPAPGPPDGPRASAGWRPLAVAWLQDPPATGLPAVDEHLNRPAEMALYDTAGLARPGEVGALRRAVLGEEEAAATCETRAALTDVTLLTLALTACGALGLDGSPCELYEGHVWHPSAEDEAAVPGAEETSWLVHALRAACGAAAPWDHRYVSYDGADVKEDWGEGVLMTWDRYGNGDPWAREEDGDDDDDDDDGDGRTVRAADGTPVRVEQLWDYVEAHGCLPFDDGRSGAAGAAARRAHATQPRAATREAARAALRELVKQAHAAHCAQRVEARVRERERTAPARGGKLPLL
jgi:hypothetical protein